MSSLPNPTEVSGKHNAIYEAYYKQADAKCNGIIQAMDAARFLKKSGLSDVVLSRIWDISDPKGTGHLDKAGFFVALKLVALAQAGREIHIRNILTDTPNPPKVGEIPKIIPQTVQSVPASNTDWSMKTTDRLKYEELFESLKPINGLIAGNRVKNVLLESKLPLDTLGKIWDLADEDKDGNLDKHEFTVAMHLVYKALDKRAVPTVLPPELKKPPKIPRAPSGEGFGDGGFVANFPKDITPPPAITRPPDLSSANTTASLISLQPDVPISPKLVQNQGASDWVVTPQDLIRFESIFRECDKDKDGLVSGLEVKNVFIQSGVEQHYLAHIWSLCDTNQSGKLTLEQFALAMWLVEQKQNGIEPPQVLAPNMIPPNLKGAPGIGVVETSFSKIEALKPKYTNTELEMVSNDLEELIKERRAIEADISQREADLRIKSGEIRSLQSEFDTLHATLRQLESQKGEAQKRLDDLSSQVDRYREQSQKQEETINEQEGELNAKRNELQKLKDEENNLEKEYNTLNKEIETLSQSLQDKQLQISQVKAMITQLLETQRQMSDNLLLCKHAVETDIHLISDYALRFEADFQEAKQMFKTFEKLETSTTSDNVAATDNNGHFSGNRNTLDTAGSTTDPFNAPSGTTGFGFDDNFMNASFTTGFDDEFGIDAFSKSSITKTPSATNTDPFGDKKATVSSNEPGKDDFGSDPFAILHAPTTSGQVLSPSAASSQKSGPPPRPESPSPALPPKKSKQPPPRPAPPRPLQGPARPSPPPSSYTTSDSFGQSSTGFANFADFDKKATSIIGQQSSLSDIYVSSTNEIFLQDRTKFIEPYTSTLISQNPFADLPQRFPTSFTNAYIKRHDLDSVQQEQKKTIFTVSSVLEETPKPPTDFIHDPFKDFRYEDTFNIVNPFENDENNDNNNEQENNDNKTENENFYHEIDGVKKEIPKRKKDSDIENDKKDFFASFDDNFNKRDKKVYNSKKLYDDDTKGKMLTEKSKEKEVYFQFEDDFLLKNTVKDNEANEKNKTAEILQNLFTPTASSTSTIADPFNNVGPFASLASPTTDDWPDTRTASAAGAQSSEQKQKFQCKLPFFKQHFVRVDNNDDDDTKNNNKN